MSSKKKIDLFDFDGTLFRSPEDTPENRRKFEKITGIPWVIDKSLSKELTKKHGRFIGMRKGWYGRAETLEPPLVPIPAPPEWFITKVCEAFKKSKNDPETITLMVTGRYGGLRSHVLRICHDGKLFDISCKNQSYSCVDKDVQCFFLGDNGPNGSKGKPSSGTFEWKTWLLKQFLDSEPNVTLVEIWEDREEHVAKFQSLNNPVEIKVNHVL